MTYSFLKKRNLEDEFVALLDVQEEFDLVIYVKDTEVDEDVVFHPVDYQIKEEDFVYPTEEVSGV